MEQMVILRKQLAIFTAKGVVASKLRSIKVGKVARLLLFSGKAE